MTQGENDQDLQRDFEALRGRVEGSGRAPDFATMMARARAEAAGLAEDASRAPESGRSDAGHGSRRSPWVRWAPLAAAAAAAGLLLIGGPGPSADAQFERLVANYSSTIAPTARQSPTASLMNIPGIDLGAVPSFGAYSSGVPGANEAQERNR